ncbi:MAG: ATP-binding protein [Burkholderiaceae bacterium]
MPTQTFSSIEASQGPPPSSSSLSGFRLGRRLCALLALTLLLTVVAIGLCLYLLHGATEALDKAYLDRLQPQQQLRALADELILQPAQTLERLEGGRQSVPQAVLDLRRARERADQHWQAYQACQTRRGDAAQAGAMPNEEASLVARIAPQIRTMDLLLDRLAGVLQQGDSEGVQRLQALQILPAGQTLQRSLRELVDLQTELARRQAQQHARDSRQALELMTGPLILGPLAGVALAVLLLLRHARERRSSESKARRQTADLRLLLDARELASQAHGGVALYRRFCRLIADSGHATLVCAAELREGVFHVVAAAEHRSGERPWHDTQLMLNGSPSAQQLTGRLMQGRPQRIRQDLAAMGMTFGWTAQAGLCSALLLPLGDQGVTTGALALFRRDDWEDGEDGGDGMLPLLQGVAGQLEDALSRLRREDERMAAERAASDRLACMMATLDALPMEIIVLEQRLMRPLYLNAAARSRHGAGPGSSGAIRPADLGLPAAEHEPLAELLQRGTRGWLFERPATESEERNGGEATAMLLSAAQIFHGEQAAWLASIQDVTELRRAGRDREAARASNRTKSEFLSRISHELRTPLHAMLGFAQLIQGRAEAQSGPLQDWLEGLTQAAWHLRALFDDVLDLSRIELGKLQLWPRRLDLGDLVAEVLRMVAVQADAQGVALQWEYASTARPYVLADPLRLRQVLLNLLTNAIKYNRPGGHVRVDIRQDAEGVHLGVADDGIGMDEQQLAHLFEPFNRLGRERAGIEGTGIGLSLSRELIELMDGSIRADSEPGRGTHVHLRLPAAWPQPGERSDPGEISARVLYIEDNPVNQLLVEQALAPWPGIRLVLASDGAAGLRLAREMCAQAEGLALVLLDMELPDVAGLGLLRALRADPAMRELPVVMLSANDDPQDIAEALQAGAIDYWTKPLELQRFGRALSSLLADPIPLPRPLTSN